MKKALLWLGLLGVASACTYAAPRGHGPRVGQNAPEIKGVDIDGKEFKLSDYRGKVVVVDFWSYG